VYKKPEVEFMHTSKRQNTTDNNCIFSHSQNTKEFQLNVLLTGTLLLLVSNRGRSAFPSASTCQGQLRGQ